MPRLSTGEICLDAGCLINTNGTWKRAVVINYSQSNEFDVKLIDTGMCQEILDGVSQIFIKTFYKNLDFKMQANTIHRYHRDRDILNRLIRNL